MKETFNTKITLCIKCKLKISFAEQAVHTLIYLKKFSSQVEFSKQATY